MISDDERRRCGTFRRRAPSQLVPKVPSPTDRTIRRLEGIQRAFGTNGQELLAVDGGGYARTVSSVVAAW